MFSPPQRFGYQNDILSGNKGCTKFSYYELSPQSILSNKQVNEEIIQKSSQCKGEKELDWAPLLINTSFHTDTHELQPILDAICMELEPNLIKYTGSNYCLDTEEVKLLKACFHWNECTVHIQRMYWNEDYEGCYILLDLINFRVNPMRNNDIWILYLIYYPYRINQDTWSIYRYGTIWNMSGARMVLFF